MGPTDLRAARSCFAVDASLLECSMVRTRDYCQLGIVEAASVRECGRKG